MRSVLFLFLCGLFSLFPLQLLGALLFQTPAGVFRLGAKPQEI